MNQFLRRLTPGEQVGALFVVLFGLLLTATVVIFALSLRERESPRGQAISAVVKGLWGVLTTSWLISVVF